MSLEIVPSKNIPKFRDKLWCKLYVEDKLKDFIQDYYIDKNNTWNDTLEVLQITHRMLSKCIEYYNLYKPKNKVNERVKQSIKDKYGCNSYFEAKDFKSKRKDTMISKYGAEYTLQSNSLVDKVHKTNLEKYGYENPFFDSDMQKKICGASKSWSESARKTRVSKSIERYGTEFPNQRHYNTKSAEILNNKEKFISFIKAIDEEDRTIINIANKLNLSYDVVNSHYKEYDLWNIVPLRQFRSFPEIEITNFIKTIYDGSIITNIRTIITPYELDIYLPDLKFAIEFDGTFWHTKDEKHKDILCNKLGIDLIHIWEEDWVSNRNEVLDMIKENIKQKGGLVR